MKKKLGIFLAILFMAEFAFCKEFKVSPFYKPVYKAATESFFKVGDIVVDENNNPVAVIFKGNKLARDTALGVAVVQKEDLEWALASAAGYAEKVHAMIEDKTSGKNGHLNAVSFYNEFEKWGDDIENYPLNGSVKRAIENHVNESMTKNDIDAITKILSEVQELKGTKDEPIYVKRGDRI